VSNKIEQPSTEDSAEVNEIADIKISPAAPLPDHIKACIDLVKAPYPIKASEPNVKCFYGNDGRVFFGIVFFETTDSFLVGASARLVMQDEGEIVCEPLHPMPIARIFKASFSMVTGPLPKYKYHYYLYLKTKGLSVLPDYMTGETLERVSDFIQANARVTKEDKKKPSVDTVKEELERKGVQGVSLDAFHPFILSEKIH
jgi:hypothetical protein